MTFQKLIREEKIQLLDELKEFLDSLLSYTKTIKVRKFPINPPVPMLTNPTPDTQKSNSFKTDRNNKMLGPKAKNFLKSEVFD